MDTLKTPSEVHKDSIRVFVLDNFVWYGITTDKALDILKIDDQNISRKKTIIVNHKKYLTSLQATAAAQNQTKALRKQLEAYNLELTDLRARNNEKTTKIIILEHDNKNLKNQRNGGFAVAAVLLGILIIK